MPARRPGKPSEQGYVHALAIFLMALLVLALALPRPKSLVRSSATATSKPFIAACNTAAPFSSTTASSTPIRPASTRWLTPTNPLSAQEAMWIPHRPGRLEADYVWPEQDPDRDGLLRPADCRKAHPRWRASVHPAATDWPGASGPSSIFGPSDSGPGSTQSPSPGTAS